MRIDLEFVELHNPLFLDGRNFGTKLYSDTRKNPKGSIEIWYETDLEHTFVVSNGKVAMIETTASKTIAKPEQLDKYMTPNMLKSLSTIPKEIIKPLPDPSVRAQVSGPGIGLKHTAQVSSPITVAPKTIIRRAKFQGEKGQEE